MRKEAITAPNILNRNFSTHKPKQKLATDITYIPIPNSMIYVSTILDLNNNEILEYKVSNKPDKSLSIDVVNELIKNHNVSGSILHSD
ncbi:MAG: DDE-type integrase/transposase/recombinase [Eubacteriales bacterium]